LKVLCNDVLFVRLSILDNLVELHHVGMILQVLSLKRAAYHLFEDYELLIEHLVGFLLTLEDHTYVLLAHHLHRIDLIVLVVLTFVHLRKFTSKRL
jgi:hypothetical protein